MNSHKLRMPVYLALGCKNKNKKGIAACRVHILPLWGISLSVPTLWLHAARSFGLVDGAVWCLLNVQLPSHSASSVTHPEVACFLRSSPLHQWVFHYVSNTTRSPLLSTVGRQCASCSLGLCEEPAGQGFLHINHASALDFPYACGCIFGLLEAAPTSQHLAVLSPCPAGRFCPQKRKTTASHL